MESRCCNYICAKYFINILIKFIKKLETIKTQKDTALTSLHIKLGAKMVPFAGYNMPVSYSGLIEEHTTVRNKVGVFDVSHMGEFRLKGEKAIDLIQLVTSNDA